MRNLFLKVFMLTAIPLSFGATTAKTVATPKTAATADLPKIELHTEFVNGGTKWMPEVTKVKPGKYLIVATHTIKEAQDFHGLRIKDLGVEGQVNRNAKVPFTKEVTITAAMKGEHVIDCQFHPKHGAAKLIVE